MNINLKLGNCNTSYLDLSPIQEAELTKLGVPEHILSTLDRLLWATLLGDQISKYLTVFEAAELAVYLEENKVILPISEQLRTSLEKELGLVC